MVRPFSGKSMTEPSLFSECASCGRGAEACEWCENLGMSEDWEATCDCGLFDFGTHLMHDCKKRKDFKYVIACSEKTEGMKL